MASLWLSRALQLTLILFVLGANFFVLIYGYGPSFDAVNTDTNGVSSVFAQDENVTVPTLDGIVNEGEYVHTRSHDNGRYLLYWTMVDNATINMAVRAQTTGWVAIGIDPVEQMLGADIWFAYMNDDNASMVVSDMYATALNGLHPEDDVADGDNGIVDISMSTANVSQADGWTTFEFVRERDTGDEATDKVIPLGVMKYIWAYGPEGSDDVATYHMNTRGTAYVNTVTGEDGTSGDRSFQLSIVTLPLLAAMTMVVFFGLFWLRSKFLDDK